MDDEIKNKDILKGEKHYLLRLTLDGQERTVILPIFCHKKMTRTRLKSQCPIILPSFPCVMRKTERKKNTNKGVSHLRVGNRMP